MADSKFMTKAAERLAHLDQEYEDQEKKKRDALRTTATMGSRSARREASSTLSGLDRQKKTAQALRDDERTR